MCRVHKALAPSAYIVAAMWLIAAAGAQQTDPPAFRSGVHLVEVDVRAFDREGRFVSDLTRESIELLENGVAQHLHTLYLVDGTPHSEPNVIAAGAGGSTGIRRAARHTWVFVFDLNHLSPGGGFDRARSAVEAFIRDRFRDGDLGGVVAGDRMVNNRLTSVREELSAAAKNVKPLAENRSRHIELAREWPRLQDEFEALRVATEDREALRRAVARACTDDPNACPQADVAIREKARRLQRQIQQATLQTLAALNGLASGLSKMAGPKTVVLLSDGFVTHEMESTLRQVVGQMARAGGRVYVIDVRGLNRGRGTDIIDQPAASDEAGAPASFDMKEDGPNSLALDTGGLVIRNENDIGRALDTIAVDANRYYVLAYQPSNVAFDGTFRPIQVRVKRPGVRVRARRGYLALEPSRMLAPSPVITTPVEGLGTPATDESPRPDAAEPIAMPATGTIVAAPAATASAAVRLRPDTTERIREVAGDDLATSDDLAHRGWDAYQRGDVETAVGLFAQAGAKPGVRPWVLYALGLSHAALGRPTDAAVSWERVRDAAPAFKSVYLDLADTYMQIADLTKALAVLRDAEKQWPADAEIQNAIGVIHVRRGAINDAIAAFSKAAEWVPDDSLPYWNLGRAFELRYIRGRRYISSQRTWTANDEDRQKAMVNYRRCVESGGPYAKEAAEALARLEWTRK
jgi:VWFA-related protein